MKLTDQQVAAVEDAFGAQPLPADHPAMSELENVFGSHSFYVLEQGLAIFADPAETDQPDGPPRLFMIAAWTDEERTEMASVEPVDTGHALPGAFDGSSDSAPSENA